MMNTVANNIQLCITSQSRKMNNLAFFILECLFCFCIAKNFINPLLPRHRLRQNIFTKIKILACYRLNMKNQKNFFDIILEKAENDTSL